MSKFKVGDRVRIRKDLDADGDYEVGFVSDMAVYKGKLAKIMSLTCDGLCRLDIDKKYWTWSEDMLVKADFTKEDLKAGYVVKCRDNSLRLIMPNTKRGLILLKLDYKKDLINWTDLERYSSDLLHIDANNWDIIEVYGFSEFASDALEYELDSRERLWKREENKKDMTIAEIEKELGYSVKIVNESEGN
ncbi:MAG: nitrogen fixation protein NifZ [Clostridia bacterium]|jgi:hypothetical protein|nr:nitrogen fixation protein NifZ [Clostridia bacterium]